MQLVCTTKSQHHMGMDVGCGGVEAKVQQINPKFQNRDNVGCAIAWTGMHECLRLTFCPMTLLLLTFGVL
eukprot:191348-Pelagomonas_calceolata.AAC.2